MKITIIWEQDYSKRGLWCSTLHTRLPWKEMLCCVMCRAPLSRKTLLFVICIKKAPYYKLCSSNSKSEARKFTHPFLQLHFVRIPHGHRVQVEDQLKKMCATNSTVLNTHSVHSGQKKIFFMMSRSSGIHVAKISQMLKSAYGLRLSLKFTNTFSSLRKYLSGEISLPFLNYY